MRVKLKNAGTKSAAASARRSRVVFILSLLTLLFWNIPLLTDVYRVALMGTLFEVLWLPMLVSLFVLPAVSMAALIRRRHAYRSIYFYSFFLSILTIAFLLYRTAKGF